MESDPLDPPFRAWKLPAGYIQPPGIAQRLG